MPRWVIWMALTLASWGVWAVLPALVDQEVSAVHSQALSTLGLAPIFVGLWWMKDESPAGGNVRRGVALAFLAGVISSLGNVAYFAALKYADATTVAPLTSMSPAFAILLAVWLLGEKITALQIGGMVASLAAILMFNDSGGASASNAWIGYSLVALVLWGVTLLLQKLATDEISSRLAAVWFLAAFVPLAVGILAWQPLDVSLSTRNWALVAAVGFTLGLGNLTIMKALASGGKASVVAPLSGLYPLVSVPLAVALLGEHVGARKGLAILLAVVAVVMLTYEPEKRVGETA